MGVMGCDKKNHSGVESNRSRAGKPPFPTCKLADGESFDSKSANLQVGKGGLPPLRLVSATVSKSKCPDEQKRSRRVPKFIDSRR